MDRYRWNYRLYWFHLSGFNGNRAILNPLFIIVHCGESKPVWSHIKLPTNGTVSNVSDEAFRLPISKYCSHFHTVAFDISSKELYNSLDLFYFSIDKPIKLWCFSTFYGSCNGNSISRPFWRKSQFVKAQSSLVTWMGYETLFLSKKRNRRIYKILFTSQF